MNAVIYARYSSDSQREESIEGQLRECREYAERNNMTIVGTYIDRALSAKTADRPEFQRMIKDSAKEQLMQQTPYLPCVLTAQQYFIRRFPCFYKLLNICRVFRPAALFQVGVVTVLCNLTQPHANITVAAKGINALHRAKESLAGNILG